MSKFQFLLLREMFLEFDFTHPSVFGKFFWDNFFRIEVKKGQGTPRNAKERQGTPRNAKERQGTPRNAKERQRSAKGMALTFRRSASSFLLFWGLKHHNFEFCYFIKCS
jgi:hypothetical protein